MRKLTIVFAAMVAGCNKAPAAQFYNNDSVQDIEISGLKEQVKLLQKSTDELRARAGRNTWTNLQPNEKGYGVVDASGVPLFISLENVTESASGSKVTLRVGNPSTANVTRLHLDLSYGKATEDGLLTAPVRNKVETVTTPLLAGQWTDLTIGLPDTLPRDLGIVRINGATAESLTLRMAGE